MANRRRDALDYRRRRGGSVQFSIARPRTRSNSAVLFVTSVSPAPARAPR